LKWQDQDKDEDEDEDEDKEAFQSYTRHAVSTKMNVLQLRVVASSD